MRIDRNLYEQHCRDREPDMPLFQMPWWLDAVCGETRWQPWVYGRNSCWPVYVKRYAGAGYIAMPPLVQRIVPCVESELPDWLEVVKHNSGLMFQRVHVPVSMKTWLDSFGFASQKGFTYLIDYEENTSKLWRKMNELSRRSLRKAQSFLEIEEDGDEETLLRLAERSMRRHGINWTADGGDDKIRSALQASKMRNQGAVLKAKDTAGRVHAAAWVVWDQKRMYYLLAGMDERIPQVGASRLIMYHAVKRAFSMNRHFDFHGGMAPEIGRVYASMGARVEPYWRGVRYDPAFLKPLFLFAKRIYAPNDRLFH